MLTTVAIISFVLASDQINWLLDAGWVAIGLPLLYFTRRSFPLSRLAYWLLSVHALVLLSGGFWTYEKMPIGVWLQELMGTQRNHYDRFGHFMQGFVPAILFREIFLRCSPLMKGGWLTYFAISSCLAFSASFEFLEWAAAVLSGENANAFLGHQGDIWDAQWDMLWALIGAILAVLLLSNLHDRSVQRIVDAE